MSSEAHAHRCGGADQDPHSLVYFLLNSEDAARGGDAKNARRRLRRAAIVVGLRRQGMRKTLKPAGDAQQPWPAAHRQSDFEQKIEND